MDLVSTSQQVNQFGVTSRDLVYRSQMSNVWNLGTQRNLVMEVYLDDSSTPLNLPLTNPIQVCFKIIHVTM
jgi:hypothetical protein